MISDLIHREQAVAHLVMVRGRLWAKVGHHIFPEPLTCKKNAADFTWDTRTKRHPNPEFLLAPVSQEQLIKIKTWLRLDPDTRLGEVSSALQ